MGENKKFLASLPSQIRLARKEAGLSQASLGEEVGVGQRTIGRWEKGKGAPDIHDLKVICDTTGKAWGWFLPKADGESTGGNLSVKPGNELLVRGDSYFSSRETGILTVYDDSRVQAGAGPHGFGFEVFDGTSIEVRFYRQMMRELLGIHIPQELHGLRVTGNSMAPAIESGQLVLFDPVDKIGGIISGERYIVSLRNVKTDTWHPLAKTLYRRDNGGWRIVSDNRRAGLPDTVLVEEPGKHRYARADTGEEVDMAVLGKVLWPEIGISEESRQIVSETLETLVSESNR